MYKIIRKYVTKVSWLDLTASRFFHCKSNVRKNTLKITGYSTPLLAMALNTVTITFGCEFSNALNSSALKRFLRDSLVKAVLNEKII